MTTEQHSSTFERWRHATMAPFRQRVFALFWWASMVSALGSLIQTVGASWLMAIIAHSPDRVALVQTAGALPFFCLSLIAGAYADTHDRRAVMLISQLLMLAASVALAAVTLIDWITPAMLLGLTFLIGCGSAAFAPAWQASLSELVPRTQLAAAVTANAVGYNVARSVGPAIGGVIVAAAGAAAAFIVNALSYLGMLTALLWWRPVRASNPLPPEPLGSAMAAGIRYVRLSPHLLAIMARSALYTIPLAATQALMPVVARDLLGGGAPTYGLLLGGFGVGAMLGALSSALLRARVSSEKLLRVLIVVAGLAMLIIGQSRWAAVTLLAHVLAGSAWTLGLTNFNIAVQMSSPRWVTGRMLATYQTVAFAGIALGSWWWGELASRHGVRESMTIAGLVTLATLIAAHWLPISVAQHGDLDPQASAAVVPPKVAIHPASGPIVVTIEYRVSQQHAAAFVATINRLGRVRRRDGARGWSICQDIDAPEHWVERFESPTWLDYLRRQTRPTLADQAIREQLTELIDGERIVVRRLIARPSGAEPVGGSLQRPEPLDSSSGHV